MKKLFIFVGDGGSGKTTLIAELIRKHPNQFKKIVTCTSRPMRVGEEDGEDYHFLRPSYFLSNSDLVLVKRTENGNYYGTRRSDLCPTTHHLLLTLRFAGISKLSLLGLKNVTVVRINISESLKVARMRQRGDTEEMIADRLCFDTVDKRDVNYGHFTVINILADEALPAKVDCILRAC